MKQGAFVFSLLFIAFTFVSFKPALPKKGKVVWGQVVHLNAAEAGE
jgi:exosome complex RNA-binding protein Csl4